MSGFEMINLAVPFLFVSLTPFQANWMQKTQIIRLEICFTTTQGSAKNCGSKREREKEEGIKERIKSKVHS